MISNMIICIYSLSNRLISVSLKADCLFLTIHISPFATDHNIRAFYITTCCYAAYSLSAIGDLHVE